MFKINILYGSAGGNTELVCEKIFEIFVREFGLKISADNPQSLSASSAEIELEILKAKLTKPEESSNCDFLIMASPTYGHGQLEKYFGFHLTELGKFNVKTQKLKAKPAAAIGLGDPKYDDDYHIESAKIIMDFIRENEMENVYMPLRISKSPLPFLDNHVERWGKKIIEIIRELKSI